MRENDARTALDEALATIERLRADLARVRAAHGETMRELDAAVEARDKADERTARWTAAYERLEAKLANARIKAKALADALR